MLQPATTKNEKIEKCWYYVMLTLSTVKFVGATTKAQDLPSQSQPHHGDQNRGKPLEELPTFTKLLLFVCSFVVFNVTPMQWHWGRGKTFLFTKAKRITSPEQWLVTLSPDWSQMTFLPKITPDDTPGGFSMQLVIEYSLYSKSWLYGYGRTLHCQSLSVSLDTVRREWDILSNCSLQLSTLSDQNIKKIPHDCPM